MDDVVGNINAALASVKAQAETETAQLSAWEKSKAEALVGTNEDPLLVHDAFWALLLSRANEIIQSPRKIGQQKLAIKAVARDLFGNSLTISEISDLYDQLDTAVTAYEAPVIGGGEFLTYSQSWLVEGLFLNGLNLLVGMPSAGKSRLLVAVIRAFLANQGSFLNRTLLDGGDRNVLLIGTDQDRQQWGDLLSESGLAKICTKEAVDGQEQVLYRLHDRITLHTSGGGFRLDADGMRYIRDWNIANHGGICIIDSLSAVLPTGISENDETAGRLIRQIEAARQGNCCIVTHHSNKQAALSGELGVYSGSGHGSIDRAVSRFIGLAYEMHVQNGKETLHKESPRRIITSQKRGAGNQRIIVENGNFNTWDYISTAAEDRELKRQEKEDAPDASFKGWKRDIYACTTDEWLTTSQVHSRLAPEKAKKHNSRQQVRRALRELETDHGLIECKESTLFQGELSWRRKSEQAEQGEILV